MPQLHPSTPAADEPQEGDEALMLRVASGEHDALAALYQRHAGLMLGLAVRLLRERREAEDAVQDAFVETWKHAGDFDATRGPVRAWLLLRVRSRCLDRLRASDRARSASEELRFDGESVAPPVDGGPDHVRVRAALEGLPEAQRACLVLAWFSGLSGSQIADQLGVPLGTVKTRLALGMAKLRATLADPETP